MGSFTRPQMFDPLDLEIIDRVYEAAWAHIIASVPDRDQEKDAIRQEALRMDIRPCWPRFSGFRCALR